jgi:hypothetical protein
VLKVIFILSLALWIDPNEDGTNRIPTIVNGVTNVNPNPKHKQEDSDSVSHLINNF